LSAQGMCKKGSSLFLQGIPSIESWSTCKTPSYCTTLSWPFAHRTQFIMQNQNMFANSHTCGKTEYRVKPADAERKTVGFFFGGESRNFRWVENFSDRTDTMPKSIVVGGSGLRIFFIK